MARATFAIPNLFAAAAVALVGLCTASPAPGQPPVSPQPPVGNLAGVGPLMPPARPAQAEPSVFRYPRAVSGSRFLTSVYGPRRPTYVTQRLTHVPSMFGDSFLHGQTLQVTQVLNDTGNRIDATLDLPVAGGTHLLIAENNKALPTDRVYFNTNHHHNALLYRVNQDSLGGEFDSVSSPSVDRFTFGFEKTFLDGVWSAEVRIPFSGRNDMSFLPDPDLAPDGVSMVDSSVFGNVSLITKTLLYADDDIAFSAGLGVEFPTGDDARAQVGPFRYTVENDAVHLHPYASVLGEPGDRFFYNAFLQFDIPTGGNGLRSTDLTGGASQQLGRLDDQELLRLSAGTGYWFFRDPRRDMFTGVAGLLEMHYTTTLGGTDTVDAGVPAPVAPNERHVLLHNRRNHYGLLNLTTGLHVELTPDALLRLAVSLPMLPDDNRFFDAESILQFTYRF